LSAPVSGRGKATLATEAPLSQGVHPVWQTMPTPRLQPAETTLGHVPDAQVDFDFSRHVRLSAADLDSIRVHKLSDMGYEVQPGEIDFAYSEPFPLLTEEGLQLYRNALISKQVLENCYYSCPMVPLTIRNMAAHNSFIRGMSTSSELLAAISVLTGGELAWHPFKVEHMMTNIQMTGREATKVFDWHNDSNCFVLLANLSDIPEDARGGGTLMKDNRTGDFVEVRAPAPGYGYIMQGKRVVHAANASKNWTRVISVISFVQRSTFAPEGFHEDSVDLFLARNYTDHGILDKEYMSYRLEWCMDKVRFLQQRYLNEATNDFTSSARRDELRQHLQHLVRNLQIAEGSLKLLDDFEGGSPSPLRPDEVPVEEIASWVRT